MVVIKVNSNHKFGAWVKMRNSKTVLIDKNPGRNSQTFGIARELGTDVDLIHEPSVGVVGNKGDSQCYIGVSSKVEKIHEILKNRIGTDPEQLSMRLVQPEFTIATSDGIRNGCLLYTSDAADE